MAATAKERGAAVKRKTLWFVTPAFRRFELTAICLRQRAWVCRELAKVGIDATCVVIADDENLATARRLGFYTVERSNDLGLGCKFNDGYQYALDEGADYVAPIGSDTWVDPASLYPENLPRRNEIACSHHYMVVHESGERCLPCWVDPPQPSTTVALVFPGALLRASKGRPCLEHIRSGCDGSLIRGLTVDREISWRYVDLHPLQNVAFQSNETYFGQRIQISSYDNFRRRWHPREQATPVAELRKLYPARLVREIEHFYSPEPVAA